MRTSISTMSGLFSANACSTSAPSLHSQIELASSEIALRNSRLTLGLSSTINTVIVFSRSNFPSRTQALRFAAEQPVDCLARPLQTRTPQCTEQEANPTYGRRPGKHIEAATHHPCGTTRAH